MSEEELKAFRNLSTFSTKYIVNKKASSENDIVTMFIYIAKLEVELEHKEKEIERLTKRLEESQLAYLQVDKDKQKLHSIIKEVREYVEENLCYSTCDGMKYTMPSGKNILEILDKENI